MATIKEILKSTYQLTFDAEVEYDWALLAEVIVDSENVGEDLYVKQLVNNKESKEKLQYWQDLFFMEVAGLGSRLTGDENVLFERIKKNPLFQENEKFIRQLPKVTTALGRELFIDEMIANDDADELIPDQMLENALKKKSREEFRNKIEEWNEEEIVAAQYGPTASFDMSVNERVNEYENTKLETHSNQRKANSYKIWFSIAAIVVIGFLVWQPNKLNADKLYNSYSYNDQVQQNINEVSLLTINKTLATRGNDYTIDGLSPVDYEKAILAIRFIREGEFYKAKSMLIDLDVESKKNNQLLFFQAVAELNTNDEENAIVHFKALSKVKDFIFKEDVSFQMAMLELKFGKRKDAKEKLQKIVDEGGKYGKSAEEVLDKMRWF